MGVKTLKSITKSKVRFSEVDSMSVVWHGNYVKYIEDGREAFGAQYGLGYLDVYSNEVMTPVVKMDLDYKQYLKYGDEIIIETEFVNTAAAKINFRYKIFRASDNRLVLTASTTQVFVDMDGNLLLTNPEFFEMWKSQWNLTI
jgi:acyl-CoA thioester hydrolase